jgi:hypothetical protein
MSRPEVLIVDIANQTETLREMNDEEYAQHLINVANAPVEPAE